MPDKGRYHVMFLKVSWVEDNKTEIEYQVLSIKYQDFLYTLYLLLNITGIDDKSGDSVFLVLLFI